MDITFTGVAIKSSDEVFITSIIDEYADESPDHCLVLRYSGGSFKQLMIDHAVVATLFNSDKSVCFVGPTGTVTIVGSQGVQTEEIDASDLGPSSLVNVRGAAMIGSRPYVCGMARLVYRREEAVGWSRVDQDVFVPRARRKKAVGFHAIAGTDERSIFAVGQYGEIWHFDGRTWTQEESPASVALTQVAVASDGSVVAAGLVGTVLRGRVGAWEVVADDATEADFWGVAEYRGRVYLSSHNGLYLLGHDELEAVNMGLDGDLTTAYVDAADGVIWSVGQKSLAVSADGELWRLVPNPVVDK